MALGAGLCRFLIVLVTSALATPITTTSRTKHIHIPLSPRPPEQVQQLFRRKIHLLWAFNDVVGYPVTISVGQPPQTVLVDIDTVSPDFWVNPHCSRSDDLRGLRYACHGFESFDDTGAASDVDTVQKLAYGVPGFKGNATVRYHIEDIRIGDGVIKSQPLGVAVQAHNLPFGRLGLGPHPTEGYTDDLLLSRMTQQGLIDRMVYALDLRPMESAAGSITFGGADQMRFFDDLVQIDMLPFSETPNQTWGPWISLIEIGLAELADREFDVVPSTDFLAVLLDSGSPVITLPAEAVAALHTRFQAREITVSGTAMHVVDCGLRRTTGVLEFTFVFKTITVPWKEVIVDLSAAGLDKTCVLMVQPAQDGVYRLGEPFLRAAYAVFDWESKSVWLGQSSNCDNESAIVEFGSGVDAIPTDVEAKCLRPDEKVVWDFG